MVDQAAQTSDFTAGNVPATSAAAPGGWETLTRAELETMHIDRMAEIAASMDLDLPDDEGLTDFVDPAEWPAKQVECLNELGFSAQVLQGGVTLDVVSPEQTPALREAMMVCEFRHAVDPRVATQPLPREAAQRQYEHWVQSLDCIREEGYDPPEPPSLEVWLGEYYVDTVNHWDPYIVAAHDAVELHELQRHCLVAPTDLYPPIPN